jgi:glycosyltransferase involved in cell wall biosynthesis
VEFSGAKTYERCESDLKVLHIGYSSFGGAGQAMMSLSAAMSAEGIDSQVISRTSSSLWSNPLEDPVGATRAAIDRWVISKPSFQTEITLARSKFSFAKKPNLQELDWLIVHSNHLEVLQTLGEIPLGLQVFFWMHDMRAFTGACHQSMGCRAFEASCQNCPAVRGPWKQAVEFQLKSSSSLAHSPKGRGIIWVAPSQWLAHRAKSSKNLYGARIEVIPNVVNISLNNPILKKPVSRKAKAVKTVMVIGTSSASRIKKEGMSSASGALSVISNNSNFKVFTVGGSRSSSLGTHLGVLTHERTLELLGEADLVVVPSRNESFSLVAAEALIMGKPVAAWRDSAPGELARKFGGLVALDAINLSSLSNLPIPKKEEIEKFLSGEVVVRSLTDLHCA